MKTLTRIALTFSMVISLSFAGGYSTTLGNTTFHNFDNGVSGSSTTLGNTTFHRLSGPVCGSGYMSNSGSSTTIGGRTFHNF